MVLICGLYGYVASEVDHHTLLDAARGAATRGPHGHGYGVIEDDGGVSIYRTRIPLSKDLESLKKVKARAFIGHARMATFGGIHSVEAFHPFLGNLGVDMYGAESRFALAHNGNVYNMPDLMKQFVLTPPPAVDSETIVRLIERRGPPILDAAVWAVNQVSKKSKLAVLILSGENIIAIRRGHPLYAAERPNGLYVSSREFASSTLLSDDAAHVMGLGTRDKPLIHTVRAL